MVLLWGRLELSKRGPKPGLTVERVVAEAIALADSDGVEAVSMRAVAERLGKSAMALYTYVPGKAEFLDLMLDRVLAELPTGYDGPWRVAVEAFARDGVAFYQRHPWVLAVSGARAVLGPTSWTSTRPRYGFSTAWG